jgi:hypothetical protein
MAAERLILSKEGCYSFVRRLPVVECLQSVVSWRLPAEVRAVDASSWEGWEGDVGFGGVPGKAERLPHAAFDARSRLSSGQVDRAEPVVGEGR